MKKESSSEIKKTKAGLSALDILLICVSYTLAAVYIPLTTTFITNAIALSAIALGVCVISILVLARLARTFKAVIGYAIILGVLTLLGGSVTLMGYLAAFVLATSAFAFLILRCRSPFVYILPAVPLLVVVFATRSVIGTLISVSVVPAAILLALSVKNKLPRVSAICRISVGIRAMAAAIFAVTVYTAYGELTVEAVRAFIEAFKTQFRIMCMTVIEELGTVIEQNISEDYVTKILDAAIDTIFNLLPGIVITLSNVTAYIIHAAFITVCYPDEKHKEEIAPMLSFDMSLVSAIVYILAIIPALFLSTGKAAIAGAVAENVVLVLAPGLIITALTGIRSLMSKKGPSCLGTLVYFGIIFMLASLSPFAIVGVALAGAVLLILAHVSDRKAKKNGNQSN